MYRIMIARNGNYYGQRSRYYGWTRCTPFRTTRAAVRRDINNIRDNNAPRVVEYL